MATAIPRELESAVITKAGQGLTTRELSAWLLSEHKVKASHVAVANLLARTRTERADAAKAIVRTELAKTLPTDLAIITKHILRLDRIADECTDLVEYRRNVEQLRKLIDTKLHYSGADQPDESMAEIAAIGQRVASRLAAQIAEIAEDEAAEPVESEGDCGT